MKEITAYLGINRDSILSWIESRGMPAVKVGRLWKFKISEVDAWMKAGQVLKEQSLQIESQITFHNSSTG